MFCSHGTTFTLQNVRDVKPLKFLCEQRENIELPCVNDLSGQNFLPVENPSGTYSTTKPFLVSSHNSPPHKERCVTTPKNGCVTDYLVSCECEAYTSFLCHWRKTKIALKSTVAYSHRPSRKLNFLHIFGLCC